jgi:hypothetical protein
VKVTPTGAAKLPQNRTRPGAPARATLPAVATDPDPRARIAACGPATAHAASGTTPYSAIADRNAPAGRASVRPDRNHRRRVSAAAGDRGHRGL